MGRNTTRVEGEYSSTGATVARSLEVLTALRSEVALLKLKADEFVEKHCIPAEAEFHQHLANLKGPREERWTLAAVPPCLHRLQSKAKELGLWNLFLPQRLAHQLPRDYQHPLPFFLTHREYGILCESLGKCPLLAPEACNCSAPDTGNMEILLEFGSPAQKDKYLLPLLLGKCRSAFLMTEPNVASSDATNLETKLTRLEHDNSNGNHRKSSVSYILTGEKWWSTGAMDPRCRLAVVVAKMDYSRCSSTSVSSSRHGAHTIVLVELPHPKVIMKRPLTVFGYDDAPHGHAQVLLNQVKLTPDDILYAEGSGFQVSQARLGPGRIHHCMRAIGLAARCYELMMQRVLERKTFGKFLWEHGSIHRDIADSVQDLQAARLLTLDCASRLDDYYGDHHVAKQQPSHVGGNNSKEAGRDMIRSQIAMLKVAVPQLTFRVIDRAIQVFGGAGVSDDFPLARALAGLRSLRIADGPDAVHQRTVALLEVKRATAVAATAAAKNKVASKL